MLLGPAQAASAVVALRAVDDDGAATPFDCNAPTAGSAFATISAAVTASSAGDFIKVCPGAYNEQVTVNKSLTLLGAQAGVDARDPARTGAAGTESVATGALNAGKTPFSVTANNVTIDGFTVEDATSSINLGFGIVLGGGTSGQVFRNNVVTNNIAGLSLGSDSTTIQHNVFKSNNKAGPVSGTGIYTDQFNAGSPLTFVMIDGNDFSANQNVGVLLGSTDATKPDSNITVSANTFENNGNGFLALDWTGSTFSRNVVTGSSGSQVVLGGGVVNSTVAQNVITGGAARGVRVGNFGGGPANSIVNASCNNISGNGTRGLEVDAASYTGTLDAGFNWWGSPTGPTIPSNPGGTGQVVLDSGGHVSFAPFLTSGVDSDPATVGFQCLPRVSVADAGITEGNSGSATVDVPVTLDTPSSGSVVVEVATEDGSATAGSDYTATSATLTFTSGETSKTVSVPVAGDTALEPDETFNVRISTSTGAGIGDGVGVATIANDDALPTPAVPPGQVADLTAPVASALKFQPSSFPAATSGPSVVAAAAKKPRKTGAKVTYGLTEAATTTFTVERAVAGRISRGTCRPQTRANRSGRRCTLFRPVPGSFTHAGGVNVNSFRFTGRLGGKTLKPASYRLNAVPADAAGNVGQTVRASFTIKR
jgi:hypothetical protein